MFLILYSILSTQAIENQILLQAWTVSGRWVIRKYEMVPVTVPATHQHLILCYAESLRGATAYLVSSWVVTLAGNQMTTKANSNNFSDTEFIFRSATIGVKYWLTERKEIKHK